MNLATARRRMVLAFILGVLVALVLAWFTSCMTGGANPAAKIADPGRLPVGVDDTSFSIDGDLSVALEPGRSAALDLRLTNPSDRKLGIRSLAVAVTSVSAPHATIALPCAVEDFTTSAVPLVVTLPARSTKALSALGLAESRWPHVSMLNTDRNQNGCQGATIRLSYTGTGSVQ